MKEIIKRTEFYLENLVVIFYIGYLSLQGIILLKRITNNVLTPELG
jgi:hypothetical protein